jgi:DNA-binding phage protein
VKNPCGELVAILLNIAEELDCEREAQALTVAELARRAKLGRRTLTYGRKVQAVPRLSTFLAQARGLNLRLVVRCEPMW